MPRPIKAALLAGATSLTAFTLLLPSGAGATSSNASAAKNTDRSCAWILEPTADRENILFPELTTRYLGAVVPVPPGGSIEITGQFPHARYMSLQTYSHTLQSLGVLRDEKIVPDPGSTNPYLPNANRRAKARAYTVRIVHGVPPAGGGPPNTLYDTGPDGTKSGFGLAYRIYLPDRATDTFGGVPAPELAFVLADGTRIPIPICADPLLDVGVTQGLAGLGIADLTLPPVGLFAHREAVWRKYENAPTGYGDIATDNDALGSLEEIVAGIGSLLPSGLGENADNKYVSTLLSREFGSVAVISARLPKTPHTWDGQKRMRTGQMRFWSMCSGNILTQALGCLTDEEVRTNGRRVFRIAVSTAADRPPEARAGCRVGWIPWGPDVRAIMIMRNMLPSSDFKHSIQAAERGTETATLGRFYPKVEYFADETAFGERYEC